MSPPSADERPPTSDASDASDADNVDDLDAQDDLRLSESISRFVREAGAQRALSLADCLDQLEAVGDAAASRLKPGDRVGRYRIVEAIGEGGMGTVFAADQESPIRRAVALKLLRDGVRGRSAIERFRAEQATLARLEHPNIARIYDADVTADGRPFFAMELVPGPNLLQYCDERRLGLRERLRVFAAVCRGVQHAHQKGVIHRDIKPSNVLVIEQDGAVVPKVIDFGLALVVESMQRDAESGAETGLGAEPVGTLDYMSPEQWSEGDRGVDTRTDVYALGVVMYQLLAGVLPWEGRGARAPAADAAGGTREGVATVPSVGSRARAPLRPSERVARRRELGADAAARRGTTVEKLARSLAGDLDAIALHALAPDRDARYGSALDLAADVERHLADLPVLVARPGARVQVAKFVRRHRVGVSAAAVALLALLAGLAASTYYWARAVDARAAADAREHEARRTLQYLEDVISSPFRSAYDVPDPSLVDVLLREEAGLAERFAGMPRSEAHLRRMFAGVLYQGRRYDVAFDQYSRALGLLDATPPPAVAGAGSTDSESAVTRFDCVEGMALTLIALGRPAEAEAKMQEFARAAPPPSIIDSIRSNRVLAKARAALGDAARAEALLRENVALAAREDAGRPTPVVEELIRFLVEHDRAGEAVQLCEAAEQVRAVDGLPARRGGALAGLHGLALLRQGDLDRAESVLKTAWARLSPGLPDHHPITREVSAAFVELYTKRGDAARAAEWTARLAGSGRATGASSRPPSR